MYDYRGTGLSTENPFSSSLAFRPTYESIVVDGEKALQFAFSRFENVSVVGSFLGGGVATASLDRYLTINPNVKVQVSLINHDSFSTTPKVVMPNWPLFADWAGWGVGGYWILPHP